MFYLCNCGDERGGTMFGDIKGNGMFKLGCFKVLPLVYDDSLSYYEVLCKLTKRVNDLTEYIGEMLEEKVVQIIDKYFNQLMINAIYDSDTETIILSREIIAGEGTHVYSAEDNSMTIE